MVKVNLLVIILAFCLIISCKSSKNDVKKEQDKGESIALVNNAPITTDDFKDKLIKSTKYNPTKYETFESKKELLNDLIDFELLYQAAKEKGFDNSVQVKRIMVRNLLKDEVNMRPNVEEPDMKAYYEKNLTEFQEVRASHILLKSQLSSDKQGKDYDPLKFKEEQRKKAEELLARAKKGEDFAELAKKYSEDMTNAPKGGDLDFFTAKKMVPQFSDVAFAMKNIGDLSDVVETRFGFHIIKLTDRRNQDFQKVIPIIKNKMIRDKRNDAYKGYVEEIKKKYKVEVFDDKIKKIIDEVDTLNKNNPTGGMGHNPGEVNVEDMQMNQGMENAPGGRMPANHPSMPGNMGGMPLNNQVAPGAQGNQPSNEKH